MIGTSLVFGADSITIFFLKYRMPAKDDEGEPDAFRELLDVQFNAATKWRLLEAIRFRRHMLFIGPGPTGKTILAEFIRSLDSSDEKYPTVFYNADRASLKYALDLVSTQYQQLSILESTVSAAESVHRLSLQMCKCFYFPSKCRPI